MRALGICKMERAVGLVVKKSQMDDTRLRVKCLHLNLLEIFALEYPVSTFYHLGYRKESLKAMMSDLLLGGAITEEDLMRDPLYSRIL